MPKESLENLMERYASGDAEAFGALYEALAPRVYAYLCRSLSDRDLAREVLQETFLRLHRVRTRYDVGHRVLPWVITIAANLRRDLLRRRRRRREDLAEPVDLEAAPAPEVETPDADLAARLLAAVRALPPGQRDVILLHKYEGLSFEDVARATGSTVGAVKLRAFRGYETLRKKLRDLLREELGR
jgi:RNA polymerase sigma-70 factor (ECF subfamily)